MPVTLAEAERAVAAYLRERGDASIHDISAGTGLGEFTVLVALYRLEKRGLVELVENHSELLLPQPRGDSMLDKILEQIPRLVETSRAAPKPVTITSFLQQATGQPGSGQGGVESGGAGRRGRGGVELLRHVLERLGGSAGEILVQRELERLGLGEEDVTRLVYEAVEAGVVVVSHGAITLREWGWAEYYPLE